MTTHDTFLEVLLCPGRAAEIAPEDDVYGWLIGSWELDVVIHFDGGSIHEGKGEVHFARVLEGRAVQDVWISPRRADRESRLSNGFNMYGSTIRIYDPATRAWRVTWLNPITGAHDELVGRWSGKDIVQMGKSSNGASIRWSFTDITPSSFRWLGERLNADGESWFLQAEFQARKLK
jgi:hypothetical protein